MKNLRNNKGAALVEYSLLVAGVALSGAASVAMFGHKTTDMMGAMAAVLPGAHADDNSPVLIGKLLETDVNAAGALGLDLGAGGDAAGDSIIGISNTERLATNLGNGGTLSDLVVEP